MGPAAEPVRGKAARRKIEAIMVNGVFIGEFMKI
jgi:hypothetical protein